MLIIIIHLLPGEVLNLGGPTVNWGYRISLGMTLLPCFGLILGASQNPLSIILLALFLTVNCKNMLVTILGRVNGS